MDKQILRKQLRGQRRSCTPLFVSQASEKIFQKLIPYIEEKTCIGIYVSDSGEVDTHKIIEYCFKVGKKVAVPLVKEKGKMVFIAICSFEDLEIGHYGLLEPKGRMVVEKSAMDCVIIPLVGFNARNYRIGQGGGYYDRYLQDYDGLKIGLAYRFQYCEFLEDKFDIACDLILSE